MFQAVYSSKLFKFSLNCLYYEESDTYERDNTDEWTLYHMHKGFYYK